MLLVNETGLGVVLDAVVFEAAVATDFDQALVEEEGAPVSSPPPAAVVVDEAPGGGMIGIAEAMGVENVRAEEEGGVRKKTGEGREK